MSLDDYQIEYRGVILGGNTYYDLVTVEGLHDLIIKDSDRENPRSQGMIPGMYTATTRSIKCNVDVRGTAGSVSYEKRIQNLLSVMSSDANQFPDEDDDRFKFKFPGEDEKFLFARPVRRGRKRSSNTEWGIAPISFELKTYDPRTYSTTEISSGEQTSTFEVINDGDAYGYPILEFNPDINGDIVLNNETNGDSVIFDNAGATSGLILDMGRFVRGRGDLLIAYRSSTNHYGNWVTPRIEFRLSPGINELELVTGDSVVVKSRDTWM